MRCLITNYLMFYVDLFSCSCSISCQTLSTAYTFDYSSAPLTWFIRHNFINLIGIRLQFFSGVHGARVVTLSRPSPTYKQFLALSPFSSFTRDFHSTSSIFHCYLLHPIHQPCPSIKSLIIH